MKLNLIQKIITVKEYPQELEIEVGMDINYYGNKSSIIQGIDEPFQGVIEKDKNGFFIVWDDGDILLLNGSDHSNSILKDCGWG